MALALQCSSVIEFSLMHLLGLFTARDLRNSCNMHNGVPDIADSIGKKLLISLGVGGMEILDGLNFSSKRRDEIF